MSETSTWMHLDVELGSCHETQEYRILIRKFKSLGVLPGKSGIQDTHQEIQEPRIPGRKSKNF